MQTIKVFLKLILYDDKCNFAKSNRIWLRSEDASQNGILDFNTMTKVTIYGLFMLCIITGCNDKKNYGNMENLKRIRIGMHVKDVREIMGEPDGIATAPFIDHKLDYMYNSPFGFSDDFHVYILKQDSLVTDILSE